MRKLNKTYYKKKCDALVSEIVRRGGKCQWCDTPQGQMQCAHVIGRANHTLRFDFFNVLCLCATCHRKAHNDPIGFIMWFEKKFSGRYMYLCNNKNRLTKRTAKDYREMYELLKTQ